MDQSPGYVSLWTGVAESDDDLEAYLTFDFTDDGDAIPCDFGKDFCIEWFDDDFREAGFKAFATSELYVLLNGQSDAENLIPRFVELCGDTLDEEANVLVLLFYFRYDGRVSKVMSGPVRLTFQGCVHVD